jgi:transposase InsO family protein
MAMPYTINPHLPRLRMRAAKMVLDQGLSTRQVARHTGFNQSTIVRWVQKAEATNRRIIPTESSRPHSHPKALPTKVRKRIIELRLERSQCAEILHYRLTQEGIKVSLSSVKRTLKRQGLIYPSAWKKWHQYPERPKPEKPGSLAQIDSMFEGQYADGFCAYAFIDIYSRWAYAEASTKINAHKSLAFVKTATKQAPFQIQMIQSDHGSEFAKWFTKQIEAKGVKHRHSRVRRPTDNSHVERFIQTLQKECLDRTTRSYSSWKKAVPEFIHYYNTERPHMGLNMRTPLEVMRSY